MFLRVEKGICFYVRREKGIRGDGKVEPGGGVVIYICDLFYLFLYHILLRVVC